MTTQSPRQPVLTDLLLYPTARCNLRCRHCYYDPTYDTVKGRQDGEVAYEQICRAVDELLPFGLRSCKLSGGEPFLRDDLLDLCCHLDAKGLRVLLETNGTLVEKQHAETLARLRRRVFVSISIDGAKAETHERLRGVRGCFQKTLTGLGHLVQAGINTQAIAAAYEDNKNELPDIIDLCAARGVRSVKVNFISAIRRARALPRIAPEECLDLDVRLAQHAAARGIQYRSTVPVGLTSVTRIMGSCALKSRCNITSTLAILADGTISICGMGRHSPDFQFGKLKDGNASEVWMTHPTLQLIRQSIPSQLRGICGRCVARSACLGHCRLESEKVTLGTLFDPFPTCAEMDRRGLFPASRIIPPIPVSAAGASVEGALARERQPCG